MNWFDFCVFMRLAGFEPPERPAWWDGATRIKVHPVATLKELGGGLHICIEAELTRKESNDP